MLKNNILKLYKGILEDANVCFPDLNLGRDLLKISKLLSTRGVRSLQIDLTNLDRALLDMLASGKFQPRGPLTRTLRGSKVPVFLQGLWKLIMDNDGCLLEDANPDAILFIRQVCLLMKRFGGDCPQSAVDDAIDQFLDIEESLRMPTNCWGGTARESIEAFSLSQSWICFQAIESNYHDNMFLPQEQSYFENSARLFRAERLSKLLWTLQTVCDEWTEELGLNEIQHSSLGNICRHGPGSVANQSYQNDKFDYGELLEVRHVFFCDVLNLELHTQDRIKTVPYSSKLIVVPKDATKPRLIASEPVVNQFLQQGLSHWFLTNVRRSKLWSVMNITDQVPSQQLARRGSKDGSLATIDLASASDRLSCWTVERVFRAAPNFLHLLDLTRTPTIRVREKKLPLRKFASQGSATNFPIQTFVYTMLLLAVNRANGIGQFTGRCYGDDIIVATECVEDIKLLLDYLELKVNESKSFSTGLFRESCGGDYFNGYDVTPVKLKTFDIETPESRRALLDTSNLFYRKGFWRASDVCAMLLKEVSLLSIVGYDSGAVGLHSVTGVHRNGLETRYNLSSQRIEMYGTVFKAKTRRKPRDGTCVLRDFLCTVHQDDSDQIKSRITSLSPNGLVDHRGWLPAPYGVGLSKI
ncbi:TPA_asm: RNA-directed RNA polymerase [ssRNA phage SRR6960799_32]|uniref:RNA-directed RNA polymerase n=1 Tax=ssRNA phage SRR6960799_32 TaxID=2786590 RepID=A0A8S5L0P2_9VIRU|nr:RNA-directed RNA polymerase [ssRNA phage SRR6960799_32]DAD50698.1 TPA_asm: RNA-directed RNA polymerase [ssRNA phage SRR6960799_32]